MRTVRWGATIISMVCAGLPRAASARGPAPGHDSANDPAIATAEEAPELLVDDAGAPPEGTERAKKAKKDYDVDVRLRIVGGVRHRNRNPSSEQLGQTADRSTEFKLRQVRAAIKARYKKVLSAKASVDLADLLDTPRGGKVIRDGWGNVRVHRAFQVKVGQFKRPYSRLELRGVSKLPFVGRGLFNSRTIEDLGYGDRAVGAMVWGRIKPKVAGLHRLTWKLSGSNDAIDGAPKGVDVHGRAEYEPTRWLSIGAGGAYKSIEDPLEQRRDVFGAGGDIEVRGRGVYAAIEADAGQDWTFADQSPWTLGLVGYLSYDWQVARRTVLQPAALVEFTDANMSFSQSEAVRIVANFNVVWTKHLRILPQVHFVEPLSPVTAFNPFVRSQTYALWLSVQL